MNNRLAFNLCSVRVEDHQTDDVFYVYPDAHQQDKELPSTLDDAYGDGFLVISLWDDKFNTWYLNIANQEYIDQRNVLEAILFEWAEAEGYQFAVPVA